MIAYLNLEYQRGENEISDVAHGACEVVVGCILFWRKADMVSERSCCDYDQVAVGQAMKAPEEVAGGL